MAVQQTLEAVAALPGVGDAIEEARLACEQLRWHPAMRRRKAEVRAESVVQAARAAAILDGAKLPASAVREASVGVRDLGEDGVAIVVRGALRSYAEAEHLSADGGRLIRSAPRQALARLAMAAARGLIEDDALGRPRRPGEQPVDDTVLSGVPAPQASELSARLDSICELLGAPGSAPALVVAGLAQAEVLAVRPFLAGNGLSARALARAVLVGRGLDPMGAAVPELAAVLDPPGFARALTGYLEGTADGVGGWLRYVADMVVEGARQGALVADAVLAGRFPQQD